MANSKINDLYSYSPIRPKARRNSVERKTFVAFSVLLLLWLSSLPVVAQTFTSVQSGSWEDGATWGNTSPGTSGVDYPDNSGTDNVVIDGGHSVTLASNSTINDFTINQSGVFDYNGFTLSAGGTITPFISVQSGNAGVATTWLNNAVPTNTGTETAIIANGHTVSFGNLFLRDLQVDAGAVAIVTSSVIGVNTSLILNGTITITGTSGRVNTNTSSVVISGNGTIDGSATTQASLQVSSPTTISMGAQLTFINDVALLSTQNLTIEGTLQVTAGDITATSSGSQLIMGGNGILRLDGSLLAVDGTLDASAPGNMIIYDGADATDIKAGAYQNLTIASTNTKTLEGNVDVNGTFTHTSGPIALAGHNLTIDGDWSYASGTVTGAGSIVLSGSTPQDVNVVGTTIPSLEINNTTAGDAAITLSGGDLTVSNLTLTDGVISTGSNKVTITDTGVGALSGGSADSYVNGQLERMTVAGGPYDFHVGDGITYKRMALSPTSNVSGGTTYRVQAYQESYTNTTAGPGLNNVSSLEYWDVTPTSGGTIDPAQVRLYWNTQSASAITLASDLRVAHFTGALWEDLGNGSTSGDVDPGYIESTTAATSYSPFTFASEIGSENPLPVELIRFEGRLQGDSVLLEWSTATEINNELFVVQKSVNGSDFEEIGQVQGKGNSSTTLHYSFVDYRTTANLSFYRLKQIDFDGQFDFSPIVTVQGESNSGVTLYPNPVSGLSRLYMNYPTDGNISVQLSSVDGKIRLREEGTYREINQKLSGTFSTLEPGVFVLHVESATGHYRIPFKRL